MAEDPTIDYHNPMIHQRDLEMYAESLCTQPALQAPTEMTVQIS